MVLRVCSTVLLIVAVAGCVSTSAQNAVVDGSADQRRTWSNAKIWITRYFQRFFGSHLRLFLSHQRFLLSRQHRQMRYLNNLSLRH